MKAPRRPRRNPALVYALYVNAGLLLAILAALLSRGGGLGNVAVAGPQMQPIAGGGGVFLMPAQFSTNTWGCYVMDIDTQNICAYQYLPGANQLRFVASRNYREDTRLRQWNTGPDLADIARLVKLDRGGLRGAPPAPGEVQEAPVSPPAPPVPTPPVGGGDSGAPIRTVGPEVPPPATGPAPATGETPATGQSQPPAAGGGPAPDDARPRP